MKKIKSLLKKLNSKGKTTKEDAGRDYLAEQLEPRVLYSGTVAPDVSADDQPVQEAPDNEPEAIGADGAPSSAIEAAQQASAEMEQFVSEGIQIVGGETDIAEDQAVVLLNPEKLGQLDGSGVGVLTQEVAAGVMDAASERWSVSGVLTDQQQDALGDFSVQVADLEGDLLLSVSDDNSTIVLDIDAAGRDWFVDGSPLDDSEFTDRVSLNGFRADSDAAIAGVDVLTVLMESQGALLGVDGLSGVRDLAATGIVDGLRRIPFAEESLTNPDEVTTSLVADLAQTAAQRWEESGLTDAQIEALEDIEYRVVDLQSGIIGSAEDGVISIDLDAAGKGWFVDLTPQDDSEFNQQTSATSLNADEGAAAEGVDLLSVIMHEQGHVLGLEHVEDSTTVTIMTDLFSEGDRRLLEEGEAEGAIPGSLDGAHYATVTSVVTVTGITGHDGGNWNPWHGHLTDMVNGSNPVSLGNTDTATPGMDISADPNDPSAWTLASGYTKTWHANSVLDSTTSANSKVGWVVLDFSSEVANLDKAYLWASRGAVPGEEAKDYNLYYSSGVGIDTLPAMPQSKGKTGDYDFSSGDWTQIGSTNTLGAPSAAVSNTVSLGGVSARYIGIEILSLYNPAEDRVAIGQIEITSAETVPQLTGTAGGTDSWNEPTNWDSGAIPSGGESAIVGTGTAPFTAQITTAPPAYNGSLTVEDNSTLQLRNRNAIDVLLTPSDITLNTGATLDILDGSPTFGDIELAGDANITLRGNGAHHETVRFGGEISGAGGLLINGVNNDTFHLDSTNTFDGDFLARSDANQGFRVEANATGALGNGNVTFNNAATLQIDAADVIADDATLNLNGVKDSRKAAKLIMNANDTIGSFFIDGVDQGYGDFSSTTHPGIISGSGVLSVPVPAVEDFDQDGFDDVVDLGGGLDANDGDDTIFPGAPELPDLKDNDQDSSVDEGLTPVNRMTATNGGDNSWSLGANWTIDGTPFGTSDFNHMPGANDSAIVGAGLTAQVNLSPFDFAGTLTLEDNASVQINNRSAINVLESPSSIFLNDGASIVMRDGSPDIGPITLNGATSIAYSSNGAHHETLDFDGEISGAGSLELVGVNNDTFNLNTANTFEGGFTSGGSQGHRVKAKVAGAFGTGNVTVNANSSLYIDAADTIDDKATLTIDGVKSNKDSFKLYLNADETVTEFWVNGTKLANGDYDASSGLLDAGGNALITGTGTLTVASLEAVNDTGTTDENSVTTTLTGAATSLLANDSPADGGVTEIESSLSGGPVSLAVNGGSATILTEKGATVTVNQDGTFSYDPTGSVELQALAATESTDDSFTYTMTDSLASAQAPVLVAYYPLNDGAAGTAVTGADDLIDDPDHPARDATIETQNGGSGTWVDDPERGIVFSTTEDDRLNAGTMGIEGDFTWGVWVKTAETDTVVGTRSGTYVRLGAGGVSGSWANINFSPDVNDNTWHHLALRREGSTLSVWVDGVESGTTTKTGPLDSKLEIGGTSRYGADLTGLVSDFGIWEGALSEAQIQALAAGTKADQVVEPVEYKTATVTFTVSGLNDAPEVTVTTTGEVTEDASGGATESTSSDADQAATLVAYYPLNDGTAGAAVTGADDLIDDPSHPARDATIETQNGGNGTWVDDPTRGIVFSTTEDDRLNAGTMGITGDFTWSVWTKTEDGSVVLGTRSGTYVRLGATGVSGSWANINFSPDVNDNTWHHLALQRVDDTLTVYVDGVASGSTTRTGPLDSKLEIGGSSRYNEDLTGLVSDVAIWDGALTVAQIQALAAGQKPTEIYSDVDLTDTHAVVSAYKAGSASWDGGTLTSQQITDIVDGSTFTADANGWNYVIDNDAIQFIGKNEKVTLDFEITVTDSSGAANNSATETVTITINGASDEPTTMELDVNGNLVVSDDQGLDNQYVLSLNAAGDTYILEDTSGATINTGALGGTGSGTNQVTFAASAFTGGFVINGSDGNDSLTIDFTGNAPNIGLGRAVIYHGNDPTTGLGDSLILKGGTFDKVTENLTGVGAGTIDLGSNGVADITYTGLEPVDETALVVTDRTINLPANISDAILEDYLAAGDGFSRIRSASAAFEEIRFQNPSNSLTINASGGSSQITLAAMDNGFAPTTLTLRGDAGDTFTTTANITAANTVIDGATLTVDAAGTTSELGSTAVTLTNDGVLDVNGITSLVSAAATAGLPAAVGDNQIYHFGFHINNDNLAMNLDGNAGMMGGGDPTSFNNFEGAGVLVNGPGNRGLDFNNDADFRAVVASLQDDASGDGRVIDQNDNYSNLWVGYFTPPQTGTYEFRNAGDDDRAGIWFDLDRSGTFESSAAGLGSDRGEQLSWEDGGRKSVSLTAGKSYLVAFTHREGGGGSRADFRFRGPGISGEPIVKPGDAGQAGMWSTGATVAADATLANTINLAGTGTVDVDSDITFANFVNTGGTELTAEDAGESLTFSSTNLGGSTTFNTTSGTELTLENVSGTDLATTGDGTVILPGANSHTGTTTVSGDSTLLVQDAGALGLTGAGTTASGNGVIQLDGVTIAGEGLTLDNGGQLSAVNSKSTYGGAITLTGDGKLGGDAQLVIDAAIGGGGNLVKVDDNTATLNVNNSYTGDTTVESGILELSGVTASLGSGANVVENGGQLRLTDGVTLDVDVELNGEGPNGEGALVGNQSGFYGGLKHFGFARGSGAEDQGQMDLGGGPGSMFNGGDPWSHPRLIGATELGSGPGDRGLDFNSDGDFINSGAIDRNDNYTNLWIGTIEVTADTAGEWQFQFNDRDDWSGLWIDLNQDGDFDSTSAGLGSNRGEQLAWNDSGVKTVTLAAGEYLFAATHLEGGGGSRAEVKIKSPKMDALSTINPTEADQDFWSNGNVINTVTGTITHGSSVSEITSLAGTLEIISNTNIGTTNLNFDGGGNIDFTGVISGAAAGNVTVQGAGTVTFSGDNDYVGETTVASGTLVAAHNNALGADPGITVVEQSGTLAFQGGVTVTEDVELNGVMSNISDTNTYNGDLSKGATTATYTFDSQDGTLVLGDASHVIDMEFGKIDFTGEGDIEVQSQLTGETAPQDTANALSHYGYHINNDSLAMDLNNNGGMMGGGNPTTFQNFFGEALLTDGPGNRGLDFNGDGDFTATGAIGQIDNYSNLFVGYFIAPQTGNYEFRRVADDDRMGIWFDLDDDGVFESNTAGLGSNRGEQIQWDNDGGWKSVSLTAGQDYLFAVTHREGGGGSQVDVQFRGPGVTGEPRIKPGDSAQAGFWRSYPTLPNSEVMKYGTGTVTLLNDTNDYIGETTVMEGTLVAAADNALGDASGVTTVEDGGTLGLSGGVTIAETVFAEGSGAADRDGAIVNVTGDNEITSTIEATGYGKVDIASEISGDTLTLSGGIDLNFSGVNFAGAGDIDVTGVIEGEVSAGFTLPDPTGISSGTLELWLDASDIDANGIAGDNPADGTTVTAWADKSGNGRNFVSWTKTPTYETDEFGDLPAVRFNDSDENLQMADPGNEFFANDVFLVFRAGNGDRTNFGPDWGAPIGVKDADPNDRMWMFQGNSDNFWSNELPSAVRWNGIDIPSANNFDMTEATGGASMGDYMVMNVTAGPNNGTQDREYIVGTRTDQWSNARFDTAEVIAFDTQLSAADRDAVELYLNQKYGVISLSNDVMQIGTGTTTLSGTNTYAGETTVMDGTLVAASSDALGTTDGGTVVEEGGTLGLENTDIDGEAFTLNGNGAGQGALVSLAGNNTIGTNSSITAETVAAVETADLGQVGIGAVAGATLTIETDVDLKASKLNVYSDGDVTIDGVISGDGTNLTLPPLGLNTLDTLPDGNYNFTADGQTFEAYVDNDGNDGWLLIGRGREGWLFDADAATGQQTPDDVNDGLGTPAAFAPAHFSDAIINDLLAQSGIDMNDIEIRLKRAADPNGNTYQEDRWASIDFAGDEWTWNFDDANPRNVTHEILAAGTLDGNVAPSGDLSPHSANTRDEGGNNFQRIFTWAWGGHANQQGFSYGQGVSNGSNTATSYLWESGNEQHAIPYTEVYIRRASAAPPVSLLSDNNLMKHGEGTLTLNGTNTYDGETTVMNGALDVDGSISGGQVTVENSGLTDYSSPTVLTGSGTIDAPIVGQEGTIINPEDGATFGDGSSSGFSTEGKLLVDSNTTVTINDADTVQLGEFSIIDGTVNLSGGATTVALSAGDNLSGSGDLNAEVQTFEAISAATVSDDNTAPGILVSDTGTLVTGVNFNPTVVLTGTSNDAGAFADITLDGDASFQPTSAFDAATFDASGSDKLVVVVTGEHNFGGSTAGQITNITYDGVSLTRAVDRNPVDGSNITAADIWYLDDPGAFHVSGALDATVGGNGNNYVYTVMGLSGTVAGVGATAISAPNSKSVDLTATGSGSFVVASHGMGGDGNTANVNSVDAVVPATELSALEAGSNWAGHVTSYTTDVSAGNATYSFTGGSTGGVVTIAAEFLPAPTGNTTAGIQVNTDGALVAAANFGSAADTNNGVTFNSQTFTSGTESGITYSLAPSATLGGDTGNSLFLENFAGIAGTTLEMTVGNLDPAKSYVVEILHGAASAGTYDVTLTGATTGAAVTEAGFNYGTGADAKRTIVYTVSGESGFTYAVDPAASEAASISGFQIREISPVSNNGVPFSSAGLATGTVGGIGYALSSDAGGTLIVGAQESSDEIFFRNASFGNANVTLDITGLDANKRYQVEVLHGSDQEISGQFDVAIETDSGAAANLDNLSFGGEAEAAPLDAEAKKTVTFTVNGETGFNYSVTTDGGGLNASISGFQIREIAVTAGAIVSPGSLSGTDTDMVATDTDEIGILKVGTISLNSTSTFDVDINAANTPTIGAVGVDTVAVANWRTNAQLDSDGNDQYGTDGYVVYGINEADGVFRNPYSYNAEQLVSPSYITAITPTAPQMWSGNGNFGQMEDPGNGDALTNTPLLAHLGTTSSTYTIERTDEKDFRLTILVASGDNANVTYTSTVATGGGTASQSQIHSSNGLHYHVYDLAAGTDDIAVTVSAGNHFQVTGFAFDTVPVVAGNDLIDVTGEVNLGDANLDLNLNFAPGTDDVFTIVENDLADQVVGLFTDTGGNQYAHGEAFDLNDGTNNYVFSVLYNVDSASVDGSVPSTLVAGTGNDVVLLSYGVAETSVEIDGSGNLVITDINGGVSDDDITIIDDGAGNYVISDPNLALTTSISGATRIDGNTISVPKISVTGGLIVETQGDDTSGAATDVVTFGGTTPISFAGDIVVNATVEETILSQNVTSTTGDVTFNSPVTVNTSVAVESTTGDVDFKSTVDITTAGDVLTIDAAGTGSEINGVVSGAGGLTKQGSGLLSLTNAGSTFSGDLDVVEGTVRATAGHNNTNNTSAFGLPISTGREITVASGGILEFAANDVFGNAGSAPVTAIVVEGGKVQNTGNFFNTLGPITLNSGANLHAQGGANGSYQAWRLRGDVTVGGNSASTITSTGTNAGVHLHSSTTFIVGDATGDAGDDLIVSARLMQQSGSQGGAPGNLIKTGTGTMAVQGGTTTEPNTMLDVTSDGGILSFEGTSVTNINRHLRVGDTVTGTVNIEDTAVVNVTNEILVGDSGGVSGVINQTGGDVNVSNRIRLAHWGGEVSNYNISGGTLDVTNALNVGWDGSGVFDQSGGTVTVGQVYVDGNGLTGPNSGQDDTLNISGGQFIAGFFGSGGGFTNISGSADVDVNGNFFLGEGTGRSGVVNQTGGVVDVSGQIRVAHWGGETSVYDLSAGTLNSNGTLYVGWDGLGDMNVSGTGDLNAGTIIVQRNSDLSIADNATVDATGTISLGDQRGTGTITQTGGTVTGNGEIRIGHWGAGANSQYNISGGLLDANGNISVGWDGTNAAMNVSGTADVDAGFIRVQRDGNLNISDGTLDATFLNIGEAPRGAGTVTQTGGITTINGEIRVASSATGTYNISGGLLDANGTLSVGYDGANGDVNISGTGDVDAGTVIVQRNADLSIADTSTFDATFLSIGDQRGTGTVTQTGGTSTVNGDIRIAHWGAGANSEYNISAGTLNNTAGNLIVGWDGSNAELNVTGTGDVNVNNTVIVQRDGDLYIADDATLDAANLSAGDQRGNGVITQDGGDVTFTNVVRIGHWSAGNNSIYNMNGGTLELTGTPAGGTEQAGGIYLGVDGTGIMNHTDGTVTTNFVWLDNRGNTGGTDQYNMTGGDLILINAIGIGSSNEGSIDVNLEGGTIQANVGTQITTPATLTGTGSDKVTFNTNGNTLTANDIWSGSGGFIKEGAGELILTGPANTYSGETMVNAGTLLVNKVHTGGDDYTIAPGATLTGTGTINLATGKTVQSSGTGTVSPGDGGIGTLTIGSDDTDSATAPNTVTLGGDFDFQINGNSSADLLDVNGTVTLGGMLNLEELTAGLNSVTYGSTITLIDNDGTTDAVNGTFASLPEGSEVIDDDGDKYVISYVGNDGNDVVLFAGEAEAEVSFDSSGNLVITDINDDSAESLTIEEATIGGLTGVLVTDRNAVLTSLGTNGRTSPTVVSRPTANSVFIAYSDPAFTGGVVVNTANETNGTDINNDSVTIQNLDLATNGEGGLEVNADVIDVTGVVTTDAGTVNLNANDKIDVQAAASITSNTGDIDLDAGNDFILDPAGSLTATAGQITIDVDQIGTTDAAGGIVNLRGPVTAGGEVFVTGGVGIDTFNITPSATTVINVSGSDPDPHCDGDLINLFASTADALFPGTEFDLASPNVVGSGVYTFSGAENVVVEGLEDDNVEPRLINLGITDVNEGGTATLSGQIIDLGSLGVHELRVDWGDGNAVETIDLGSPAANVTINPDGTFGVTHLYVDDNPTATPSDIYNVSVTIEDKCDNGSVDGSDTGTVNITVTNVDPTPAIVSVVDENGEAVDENDTAVLTGSFTDPGLEDTHTVVIDWADPNDATDSEFSLDAIKDLTTGATFASADGAVLTITSTATELLTGEVKYTVNGHQYLDDGLSEANFNPSTPAGNATAFDVSKVEMTVTDDDTGSNTADFDLTVSNVAPVMENVAISADVINENGSVTVSGDIVDPGTLDAFRVRITWGDGKLDAITLPAGSTSFSLDHVYDVGGRSYNIRIQLLDDDLGVANAGLAVRVINVPPTLEANPIPDVVVGETSVLTGSFTDPGLVLPHTVVVDWGDGTSSSFEVPPTGSLEAGDRVRGRDGSILTVTDVDITTGEVNFTVSHEYENDGIFNVSVTVGDETFTVTAQLTATVFLIGPTDTTPGIFTNQPGENNLVGILSIFRNMGDTGLFVGFRADDAEDDRLLDGIMTEEGTPDFLGDLTLAPFFAGTTQPGATVVVILRDEVGNEVASTTIISDLAGNWTATFPELKYDEGDYNVEIQVTNPIWSSIAGSFESQIAVFNGSLLGAANGFEGLTAGQIIGIAVDTQALDQALQNEKGLGKQ